jgi:hypothetical protein
VHAGSGGLDRDRVAELAGGDCRVSNRSDYPLGNKRKAVGGEQASHLAGREPRVVGAGESGLDKLARAFGVDLVECGQRAKRAPEPLRALGRPR